MDNRGFFTGKVAGRCKVTAELTSCSKIRWPWGYPVFGLPQPRRIPAPAAAIGVVPAYFTGSSVLLPAKGFNARYRYGWDAGFGAAALAGGWRSSGGF